MLLAPVLGRRKPHGAPLIANFGHPLGAGLQFAWAPVDSKPDYEWCKRRTTDTVGANSLDNYGLSGYTKFTNASTTDLAFTGTTQDFTVAVFIRQLTTPGSYYDFFRRMANSNGWALHYSDTGNWYYYEKDSVLISVAASTGLHTLMVSRVGGTARFYLDGIEAGSASATTLGSDTDKLNVSNAGAGSTFRVYGAFAWSRGLSAREALQWSASPYQMLATAPMRARAQGWVDPTLYFLGSITGASTLAAATFDGRPTFSGSAAASATAAGTYSANLAFSGSSAATSAVAGVYSANLAFNGSAAAVSTAAADFSWISFSGSADAVATASGTLDLQNWFSGSVTGTTTVAGTMSVSAALSGAVAAASVALGTFSQQVPLGSGLAAAASAVAADLSKYAAVEGAIAGLSVVPDVTMLVGVAFSASSAGTSNLPEAGLTKSALLLGEVTAVASADGAMDNTLQLLGSVAARSSAKVVRFRKLTRSRSSGIPGARFGEPARSTVWRLPVRPTTWTLAHRTTTWVLRSSSVAATAGDGSVVPIIVLYDSPGTAIVNDGPVNTFALG